MNPHMDDISIIIKKLETFIQKWQIRPIFIFGWVHPFYDQK